MTSSTLSNSSSNSKVKIEWSRPRQTPMTGRRKATEIYCNGCLRFHRTHRHPDGEEPCPEAWAERHAPLPEFPAVRVIPRTASR